MVAEPFRIVAHRGASAYAPENTMAAFRVRSLPKEERLDILLDRAHFVCSLES